MARIKDIAEKANVSPSTVSIIINGKARERKISQETEQKVLEVMRELNYIPNISAKIMRKGAAQEYIVALFCSFDFRNTMMTRLLYGLQNKIEQNRDSIKVIIYPYQSGRLKNERSHFSGAEFHAAVIANADKNDLDFLSQNQFSMPVILYNRILENYNSVNVDDKKIGRLAAAHLLEKGYRHPAIVSGSKGFPGSDTRNLAFRKTMQEHNILIPEEHILRIATSEPAGAQLAGQLLAQSSLPDSFWCSSDTIALGLANTLVAHGVRIPEDVGVICVGNTEPAFAQYNHPALTVIDVPIEQMGAGCYEYAKKFMNNFTSAAQMRFYDTKLIERDSTRRSPTE